jgi:hypothetical protein
VRERRATGGIVARAAAGVGALALLLVGGALPAHADWGDEEWVDAALATVDCAAPSIGTATATGRLVGGRLLGVDLDTLAEAAPMRVDNAGDVAIPTPADAVPVPGTGGEGYRDPLVIGALADAIQLQLGGLRALVPALGAEAGVLGQFARAGGAAESEASAGALTDEGFVDLDTTTGPGERPELVMIELGAVLEESLGSTLATIVSANLLDLRLHVGAVASRAAIDGCALAWTDDLTTSLVREYAIAGLDLAVDTPLVAGLTTAVEGVIDGVEATVNGIASDDALLDDIAADVSGIVDAALGALGIGTPTASVTVTIDLTAARGLLDDTISDADGILAIDLAGGTVTVDVAALVGEVYGTNGLNGLPANWELLIDAAMLTAIEDALTDAVADWVADLIAQIDLALDAVTVDAVISLPLQVNNLLTGFTWVTIAGLSLTIDDATVASLLDGTATVTPALSPLGICGITPALCTLLGGVLGLLTDTVLDSVSSVVGTAVDGVLTTLSTGLQPALDTALDAPVAALLALLDDTLGTLFGESGLLSLMVNVQNAPTGVDAGAAPAAWTGLPGPSAGPPFSTGRYDVAALRLAVLGALGPAEVAVELARSSVGSNTITG